MTSSGVRNELAALAVILLLAVLSWQMINAVATSLYRQYGDLGDPPLFPIVAAGPELGQTQAPVRAPSQLGHTGYFWSERAFHYRLSLMFAVDGYQDPDLLTSDTWQQHPDGVNAWRNYTVFMEPVYGFLYRLAGDQARPLVEFLLRLIPLIHVLMMFPLYLMARALGGGRPAAILGAAFYATCTLGFVRMTGSLLLKEDFALLCLTLFLAAHLWAWRRQSARLGFLAALLLVPLLASWHLSQFLVLVIVIGAAFAWSVAGEGNGKSFRGTPFFVFMPAAYTLAGLAAGFTPTLLARGFFLSLPMAVLYAWTATALAAWRRPGRVGSAPVRMILLIGLTAILGGLVLLNRSYAGDYNHVFDLFVQKLAHGFRLPADPRLLPFDARVFWGPPFNTPTLGEIWTKLGYHAAVLVPVVIWSLVSVLRRGTDHLQRSFLVTVPVYLVSYLMIERLGVVFLVFAAVAVALGAERVLQGLSRSMGSRALPLVVGLFLVSPVLNLNGNLGDMIRITRSVRQGNEVRMGASDQALWESWSRMFSWLRTNTPGPGSNLEGPPAVLLGEIGVSPQILLYAGRPIVLNSQFENAAIRDRYRQFLEALYTGDEKVLWDFASRHGADYLFINRDFSTATGPGSSAYTAGVAGNLDLEMNVVKMHFRPETLRLFAPVYDNEHYRILRVWPTDRGARHAAWQQGFNSWWQLENFQVVEGELVDPAADKSRLRAFEGDLSTLQDRQQDIMAAVEKRWSAARGGGARRPDLMTMHRQFVQARIEGWKSGRDRDGVAGRLANAIRARLSEIDPLSGQPLGTALARLASGEGGWLPLLASHAGEPMQHATCGQLLAMAGQYDGAVRQFEAAAAFYPEPESHAAAEMQVRLWHEVVWWQLAVGRVDQARDLARLYAIHAREGSREGDFFRTVAGLPKGLE